MVKGEPTERDNLLQELDENRIESALEELEELVGNWSNTDPEQRKKKLETITQEVRESTPTLEDNEPKT